MSMLLKPPNNPTIGYAQQYPESDERGHAVGHPISMWRITPDVIEQMAASFVVPAPDMERSRFEFAYFGFTLPDTSGHGTIGSQFGPLCGGGGSYKICIHDGVPQIEVQARWIS
jgi:hypothetical protein